MLFETGYYVHFFGMRRYFPYFYEAMSMCDYLNLCNIDYYITDAYMDGLA